MRDQLGNKLTTFERFQVAAFFRFVIHYQGSEILIGKLFSKQCLRGGQVLGKVNYPVLTSGYLLSWHSSGPSLTPQPA
jgi:hypothetical protein